jgi:hypothetical protein
MFGPRASQGVFLCLNDRQKGVDDLFVLILLLGGFAGALIAKAGLEILKRQNILKI